MATQAEWSGVFRLPNFKGQRPKWIDLDCWLYGSSGRSPSTKFVIAHANCPAEKEGAKKKAADKLSDEAGEAREKAPISPGNPAPLAVEQLTCDLCKQPIPSSKAERRIRIGAKIYKLTRGDLKLLSFPRTKEVTIEFRTDQEDVLDALIPSRRLYIMPKPDYRETYLDLLDYLIICGASGFARLITLDEDAPNVGVIRPVTYPAEFFGEQIDILVLDLLTDPAALKNPQSLKGFAGYFPNTPHRNTQNLQVNQPKEVLRGGECLGHKALALKKIQESHEKQEQVLAVGVTTASS